MVKGIIVFLILIFLIITHELGHMLVSLKLGVAVNEFSIGFGKLLFQREYKGIKYSIRLMPVGGFCDINDESFEEASPQKKIAIMSAGVIVNLATAFICFLIASQSLFKACLIMLTCFKMFYEFLGSIFNGTVTVNDFTGILGASHGIGELMSSTRIAFALSGIMAALLGIGNILPIPGFDGGRIVGTLYEWISKRKISDKMHSFVNRFVYSFMIFTFIAGILLDFIYALEHFS